MIQLGDFEIHVINDARILADAGGPFGLVPRALFKGVLAPDEENRVPMDHKCLLIRAQGRTVLVDTGLGMKMGEKMERIMSLTRPEGGLLPGLAAHGVAAESVDIVINTHLHNDHCGGNTFLEGAEVRASFPNARYYAPEREYQDALFPNERTRGTYFHFNYVPLVQAGQMTLVKNGFDVLPGIRMVTTPGHTPGHMSILLESKGLYGLYVADMASFAVHFERLGWMTSYDVEPLVTLETKRIWQAWALEHDPLLLFEHDPQISAGRLRREGEALRVNPENV